MYTAYYVPAIAEGRTNPSRSGFPTEKAAWKFIFQHMCNGCRETRLLYLRLKRRGYTNEIINSIEDDLNGDDFRQRWLSLGDEYPACSAEWWVVPTEQLEKSESFEDVFRAAGYTEVLYRDEERSDP